VIWRKSEKKKESTKLPKRKFLLNFLITDFLKKNKLFFNQSTTKNLKKTNVVKYSTPKDQTSKEDFKKKTP